MDKEDVVIYTMEYYLAIKNDEMLPFPTTWLDLESTLLSEVRQMEKSNNHIVSFVCGL